MKYTHVLSILLTFTISTSTIADTPTTTLENKKKETQSDLMGLITGITSTVAIVCGAAWSIHRFSNSVAKKLAAKTVQKKLDEDTDRPNQPKDEVGTLPPAKKTVRQDVQDNCRCEVEGIPASCVISATTQNTPPGQKHITSEWRFPQLSQDLAERLTPNRERARVAVFGPGYRMQTPDTFSVPILHELMPFFRRDHITVVDQDQAALDIVSVSKYDVETARSYLNYAQNFEANPGLQSALRQMMPAVAPDLPPSISLHQMNFEQPNLPTNSFDYIIATFSLFYALPSNNNEETRRVSAANLALLAIDGVMYLDSIAMAFIIRAWGEDLDFQSPVNIGNMQFMVTHLPHPTGTYFPLGGLERAFMVGNLPTSTSDLYAVKRIR